MKMKSTNNSSRRSGFALILSLGIMSIILLLVLSLHSIQSVRIKQAEAAIHLAKAKENAKFALYSAISELQKYTGIDQAITTHASILDHNQGSANKKNFYNPHWTGVWNPDQKNLKASFSRWLVSGTYKQLEDATSSLNKNSISLVTGRNQLPDTKAELLNLKDSFGEITGKQAWWIGDESIKLKVNAAADEYQPSSMDKYGDISALSGAHLVSFNNRNVFRFSDYSVMNKAQSFDSLKLVSEQFSDIDALFHEITTNGYGVLSNPMEGGLKKDLSYGLKMDSNELEDAQAVIADKNGKDLWEGFGPDWALVKSFYNKRSTSKGEISVQSHRTNSAGLPSLKDMHIRPPIVQHGYYPIVSRFQLYFHPIVIQDSGDYKVRMYMVPAITLWNPFDVAIEATDYVVVLNSDNFWTQKIQLIASVLDSNENKMTDAEFDNLTDFQLNKSDFDQTNLRFRLQSVRIEAGSSVMFGCLNHEKRGEAPDFENLLSPSSAPIWGIWMDATSSPFSGGSEPLKIRAGIQQSNGSNFNNFRIRLFHESAEKSYKSDGMQLQGIDNLNTTNSPENYKGIQYNKSYPWSSSESDQNPLDDTTASFGIECRISTPRIVPSWTSADSYNKPWNRIYADRNLRSPYFLKYKKAEGENYDCFDNGGNLIFYNYYNRNTNLSFSTEYIPSAIDGSGGTFSGFSETAINGNAKTILFHVPRQNEIFHTIGQLRYCNFVENNLAPNYQLCESWANSMYDLRREDAKKNMLNTNMAVSFNRHKTPYPLGDYSYMLNQSLWDRYFFSAMNEAKNKIENPRMKKLENAPNSALEFHSSGSSLMVDGAFNVNSTSKSAWKGFLGTYFFEKVHSNGREIRNGTTYGLSKFTEALQFDLNSNFKNDQAYAGYKSMTESELDLLAEKIVEQVKRRGPFQSLSHFINRLHNPSSPYPNSRPILSKEMSDYPEYMGALQAAIEKANLNKSFQTNDAIFNLEDTAYHDGNRPESLPIHREAAMGSIYQDLPAYMKQGDLLEKIGSLITVRSDSFVIRSYGSCFDNDSEKESARAFCEAYVQRLPAPIGEEKSLNPSSGNSLGRKYRITSFRWLSEELL